MNPFKDFFYYTRSERNAVMTLLGFLVIIFLLPYTYSFISSPQKVDFEEWDADLMAFETGVSQRKKMLMGNRGEQAKANAMQKQEEEDLEPISFDPNHVSAAILQSMGLPDRTVSSILNYRAKGGKFKYKESLQKIYTLSDKHYQQLYDYIDLKSEAEATAFKPKKEAAAAIVFAEAFAFDPNTATAEDFEKLGLGTATIRSIINYRTKGGQFRKKEDFKKIYTLSDTLYKHLEASIQIAEQPKFEAKPAYKPKAYYKIDINAANLDDFQQFKGIGPSYAKRILKMKEGLGGFVSVEQIGELYKLPDSTFQLMLPYLECAPSPIQKININTASLEELKAHPYLRWFHAKAIIKYRETEGPWKSVELVQILTEFDDGKGTFKKIKPYLTVD